MVYFEASRDEQGAISLAHDLVVRHEHAVLVVDECSAELHRKLESEIQRSGSRVSLTTIDFEETDIPASKKMILAPEDMQAVVNELLRDSYPSIQEWDRKRIAEMAGGFPILARLLGEAQLTSDETHVGRLDDTRIADKLLWGRQGSDLTSKKIVRLISLFTHIGFEGEMKNQRQFVAQLGDVTDLDFYRIAKSLIDRRRILQRRGRYVRLIPEPLARALATQWFQETPEEQIDLAIEQLLSTELARPFLRRIEKLDYVPEVQNAIERMCKSGGYFERTVLANIERAKLIAHSACQINPGAVASALVRLSADWTDQEWRNAVLFAETLRYLAWWESTFDAAAWLLLNVVARSDQRDTGRSDSILESLFGIHLSGTQQTLLSRLAIVDRALKSSDSRIRSAVVGALGEGLNTGRISRSGGVESQGSRKRGDDYHPATLGEIWDYWRECFKRLSSLILTDDTTSTAAAEELGKRLDTFLHEGIVTDTAPVIRAIISKFKGYWPTAYERLVNTRSHTLSQLGPRGKAELEAWLAAMNPEEISKKLHLLVCLPPWEHVQESKGEAFRDLSLERAVALAEELTIAGFQWAQHLNVLFTNEHEQRKTGDFARKIAELAVDKIAFAHQLLDALADRDPSRTNWAFALGALDHLTQTDARDQILQRLFGEKELLPYLGRLLRILHPTWPDLNTVLQMLREGRLFFSDLDQFTFWWPFTNLEANERIEAIEQLMSLGKEGRRLALNMLTMFCLGDQQKYLQHRDQIARIVTWPGIRLDQNSENNSSRDWSHLDEFTVRVLTDAADEKLAIAVCEDIWRVLQESEGYPGNSGLHAREIAALFKSFSATAWEFFGGKMLEPPCQAQGFFAEAVNPSRFDDGGQSLTSLLPAGFLIDWCRRNGDKAAKVVAEVGDLVDADDNWTQLAMELFDEFGDNEDVLRVISKSCHPSSARGSWAPPYRRQANIYRKLSGHQSPSVRGWAISQAEYLEKRAAGEEKSDEEDEIRYL